MIDHIVRGHSTLVTLLARIYLVQYVVKFSIKTRYICLIIPYHIIKLLFLVKIYLRTIYNSIKTVAAACLADCDHVAINNATQLSRHELWDCEGSASPKYCRIFAQYQLV